MWTDVGRLVLLQLFLTELLCAEGKTLFPRRRTRISAAERNAAGGSGSADGLPWCAALGGFLRTARTWTAGLGPQGDRTRSGGGSPDGGKSAAEHVFKYRSALKEKMIWWKEVEAQLGFRCLRLQFRTAKVSRVSKKQTWQSHQTLMTRTQINRKKCDFCFVCCGGGKKNGNNAPWQ